jgi:hypothetical protein
MRAAARHRHSQGGQAGFDRRQEDRLRHREARRPTVGSNWTVYAAAIPASSTDHDIRFHRGPHGPNAGPTAASLGGEIKISHLGVCAVKQATSSSPEPMRHLRACAPNAAGARCG